MTLSALRITGDDKEQMWPDRMDFVDEYRRSWKERVKSKKSSVSVGEEAKKRMSVVV